MARMEIGLQLFAPFLWFPLGGCYPSHLYGEWNGGRYTQCMVNFPLEDPGKMADDDEQVVSGISFMSNYLVIFFIRLGIKDVWIILPIGE
jgi:hypothetical protein